MIWLKRFLLCVAILLTAVIVAAATGTYLYRSRPAWYYRPPLSIQQQKDAANQGDQEFLDLVNWAAAVRAQNARENRGGAQPTAMEPGMEIPSPTKTVTFTGDELGAFLGSWDSPSKAKLQNQLSRYVNNGQVLLFDGQLILAGDVPQFDTVVSAAFEPTLDVRGKLKLSLTSIEAGRLPVPQSVVANVLSRLQGMLRTHLLNEQNECAVDETGAANSAASGTALTRLLLDTLSDHASEPVILLPFDLGNLRRTLAVNLIAISIRGDALTMTFSPLSGAQRSAWLSWLRGNSPG